MGDPDPIYPVVNPFSYHQSRHFKGGYETAFVYWPLEGSQTKIYSKTPLLHNRLLEDFERVRIERSGIMKGEYIAISNGLYLMDRNGNCFTINFPTDIALMAQRPFLDVNAPEFWTIRERLLAMWDSVPLVENGTVWSHIYHENYYHYTFEFLQKARLIQSYGVKNIVMPDAILRREFQRDLLYRAVGPLNVLQGGAARMIDPVVADAYQSYEGLMWLRRLMKLEAPAGNRRYYIRRPPKKSRVSNNIAETPEFLDFLKRHRFEAIDFGTGDKSIAEQVALMRDAAVILAPHGAGLTNLAYLNPPLSIIEYFSRRVLSASFMQIAINLGFKYFGVIGEDEDEDLLMVADVKQLDAIMEEALAR